MLVSTLQISDQKANHSSPLTILKSLNRNDVPMIRLLNFSHIRIQKISSKLQLSFSISKKAKNTASHYLLRKNIASRFLLRKNTASRCLLRKNAASRYFLRKKSDFFEQTPSEIRFFLLSFSFIDSSKPQSEQKFHQYSASHQS